MNNNVKFHINRKNGSSVNKKSAWLVIRKECRDQQKTRIHQTYALESTRISSSKDHY